MRPTKTLMLALMSTALLIGGCSRQSDEAAPADAAAESGKSAAGDAAIAAAPGLDTVAAPGVAFRYRYAFSLPGEAISEVQNQHVSACEKLGTGACRITGMDYRKESDGEIIARIDFLLAPDVAHRFGREATSVVERAEGKLSDANVIGENAGEAIDVSQQASGALQGELTRIEARLRASGMSREERASLVQEAANIRERLRGESAGRMAREKSIASTPMNFTYASEGVFAANGDPFGKAAETSWSSLMAMLSVVLTVLGLAAPWALLAALVWLAIRGIRSKAGANPVTGKLED